MEMRIPINSEIMRKKLLSLFFKYFAIIRLIIYICFLFSVLNLIYLLAIYIPKYFFSVLIVFSAIKLCEYFFKQRIYANGKKINKEAIIIGAGISGIAAAYYLQKKHIPYIILERACGLKYGGRSSLLEPLSTKPLRLRQKFPLRVFVR